MSRWGLALILAVVGLALGLGGLLIPAHLRAVDDIALQRAGRGTASVAQAGLMQVQSNLPGPAQLLAAAASRAQLPDRHELANAVDNLARNHPELISHGRAESGRLGQLLQTELSTTTSSNSVPATVPFTTFMVRSENRTRAHALLQHSSAPLAQALWQFRSVTNTVLFPAVASASGQALDTAICVAGMLTDAGHLSLNLNKEMLALAAEVSRGQSTLPLEQVLMDILSLGQRFNWGQLAWFVAQIDDATTLRMLTHQLQQEENIPLLYAAVCLTGNAIGVANYLTTFSETGMNDLRASLAFRAGGINELVQRQQQLCNSSLCAGITSASWLRSMRNTALTITPSSSFAALALKWSLLLGGGFFIALAAHFARRVSRLEQPLEVRGFHVARELLFALGLLLVVLMLSEPFLAQGSQKDERPLKLRLPMVGTAAAAEVPATSKTTMNHFSLLAMLLFFVLQSLLYVACLLKLAEIRRQKVPARLRIQLLKNEDHLFDAGLYLGFVGTIISLILVSLGVIKPSLMAAYSSTSFGILFVSIFKICHLRPLCRRLLLESELERPSPAPQTLESAEILPS